MAINLILILREAIQAKTSWRSSTLLQIIKVNATEGVGKLLVRIQKMQIMQHQPLADHILVCIFWILSALATKGKTECYRLLILPKHKLYKLLVWILERYCCIVERHFNHFFEIMIALYNISTGIESSFSDIYVYTMVLVSTKTYSGSYIINNFRVS